MKSLKNLPFYIILFFVICQIGFAIKMSLSVSHLEELLQPNTRLERNWNIRMHLEHIKGGMQAAELEAYRYAISKNHEFLPDMRQLEETREAEFRALELLLKETSMQDVILKELRSISGQQMHRFSDLIAMNERQGVAPSFSTADIKQHQENTNKLHNLISAMDKEQSALIMAKRDDLTMVYQSVIVTYILASVTFALFLLLLYRFSREHFPFLNALKNPFKLTSNDLVGDALSKRILQSDTLPRHLLAIAEEEKASLARELHDELGSNLMILRINLTMMLSKFGLNNPALANQIKETLALLKQTVDIKCHIIENLRPFMLEDAGLVASIRSYCDDIATRSGLKIDLKMDENFAQINSTQAISLYRIVQESLTNIMKYAKATQVSISLWQVNNGVNLCISDDGVGIAQDVLNNPKSHGILGMRERAVLNGGSFNISLNKEGGGTQIEVFMPYTNL